MMIQQRIKILAVDDTEAARRLYHMYLAQEFDLDLASSGYEGLRKSSEHAYDVFLVDLMMPGMNGIEFIHKLRDSFPSANVIIISQTDDLDIAIDAFREHPFDFLRKPIEKTILRNAIRRSLEMQELKQALEIAHVESAHSSDCPKPVIGRSTCMKKIWDIIDRLSQSPLCRAVLLTGESGTGKEIVARQIHSRSLLFRGPFVAVNCGLLRAELAGSELFGIEKGTATGVDARKGKIEAANSGTLFLDEITELPTDVQPMLLRALQERVIVPIGSHSEKHVDLRIIAATNRNILESVKAGRFREDLYYRIAAIRIDIPALREHVEDIPDLIEHLYRRHGGRGAPPFDASEYEELKHRHWPGNIRQLENLVIQKMVLGSIDADEISVAASEQDIKQALASITRNRNFAQIRDLIFDSVLNSCNGNMSHAAHWLDLSRSTIWEFTKRTKSTEP